MTLKNSNNLETKERELVIARLETVSPELHFSSGATLTLSRDEVIEHIKKNDDIGKEFVKVELDFLRAFKDSDFLNQLVNQ